METKPNSDDELKPLNPQKHLVRKIFRKYAKEEKTSLPEKVPFYIAFPKKTKETFEEIKIFVYNNKNMIILSILASLILILIIFLFLPKIPSANFIDKLDGNYMKGYVYLDDKYLGSTSGNDFSMLPKEYCKDTHILRLESEKGAYEWQTYPIDCKSKRIVFYIEHEKALPSKNIIFNFLDKTGSFYMSGKLYFNNISVGYVDKEISIPRDNCTNITNVKLAGKDFYGEWNNTAAFCYNTSEIQFKVS
jgi:hypothetical protein